ncbi:phospholipase D family protein [Mammaliicoccus vitulinus]|uniref:phospholipase D family protein n=1 Tax=Mammaliicoccus vitulinus TaxID=71237 RepID=UPI002B263F19|nr:phospholipase D family protein [Mammaliicoccus vitulinus]WQK88072.1 phospholipase D family protein [Mammaliicoccus vitulinus]
MWFSDNLYQTIILKNCDSYNKLKIISGYASPTFLEKVLNDVSNVFIELYIGMAQEGISYSSHKKYQELCFKYKKLQVFYQKNGKPTHIKIYQFYGVFSSDTYIGSANFSENGFMNNNELLIQSNEDFSILFNHQFKRSISCTDVDVEKYIKFYKENLEDINASEYSPSEKHYGNENIVEEYTKNNEELDNNISFNNKITNFNKNFGIKVTSNGTTLPIVTDKNANQLWNKTGINSVLTNKKSHLIKSNMHSLKEEFQSEEFKVIAYDGYIYNAKLGGKFNRELYIENWNFYYEIARIIKLDDGEPISEKKLEYLGFTSFYFEKKEENIYLMTLIKDF